MLFEIHPAGLAQLRWLHTRSDSTTVDIHAVTAGQPIALRYTQLTELPL